jgi:hypothetical protein
MKKPSILSFNTGKAKRLGTVVKTEIVEAGHKRSQVNVVVDQAGEACIKTPRAVPRNR